MNWFRNLKSTTRFNNIYKITYVLSASITDNKVSFDLNDKQEVIVEAENEFDAITKAINSKKITPYPHVYINDIKKISIVQ